MVGLFRLVFLFNKMITFSFHTLELDSKKVKSSSEGLFPLCKMNRVKEVLDLEQAIKHTLVIKKC